MDALNFGREFKMITVTPSAAATGNNTWAKLDLCIAALGTVCTIEAVTAWDNADTAVAMIVSGMDFANTAYGDADGSNPGTHTWIEHLDLLAEAADAAGTTVVELAFATTAA